MLQLNTFRNDRIRTLNVFCTSGEVASLLSRGVQKLIKSKLNNIRMEYKIFLSWLKPFLIYGRN
ncbi:hypothetical protein O3M35_000454 [Rhynocoris fuscipes]|uniref:Uncharacterized protein n=1 Tax=Rhynocoris fuscipes TaxID=488301 RepID=A0AAW1DSN7_9HEMI